MTEVRVRIPAGREVTEDMFADLTESTAVVQWLSGGLLSVAFVPDLSDDECAAVLRRLRSSSPDEESARAALADVLPTLREWVPGPLDGECLHALRDAVLLLSSLMLSDYPTEPEPEVTP